MHRKVCGWVSAWFLIMLKFTVGITCPVKGNTLNFGIALQELNQVKTVQKAEQADATELRSGLKIQREISGKQSHNYWLELIAGQYVRVIAWQDGVDVVLRLSAPDGKMIIEVDSPNNTHGPESVSVIAEVTGKFHLEVTALEGGVLPGRYEISVERLGEPRVSDRLLITAERT